MPKIVIPPSSIITYPEGKAEVSFGTPKKTSVYFTDASSGNEKNFTDYFVFWDLVTELNKLESCKLTLVGLSASDFTTYVKKKNTFKLFAEEHFAGKFRIEEVKRKENYLIEVKGIGMGVTLQDAITDQSTFTYDSTASNTIVTALCTEISINDNQELGNVSGSFSWQDKLSALFTVSNYFQADWWVDQVFPFDTDRFNIKQRRGRVPVIRNFYDDGSNRNANITKRINTEFHTNDIALRGKKDNGVILVDFTEDSDWAANTAGICGTFEDWVSLKESYKVMIYFETDQTPQYCYLQVGDGTSTFKIKELNVVADRAISEIIDLSAVKMGDKIERPTRFHIIWKSHASNATKLKVWVGRLVPLVTQFSAVSDYTNLDADLSKPTEAIPFDIPCKDSVSFSNKGIVKIGSDPIGYTNNEGSILAGCTADIASGSASAHRANVLVIPSYNGDGKADTFLSETITSIEGWTSDYVIDVNDTSGFSDTGYIIISDEVMHYSVKDPAGFWIDERNCTGSVGGAKPHSKYCRVFEYASANRYIPSSPDSGSVIDSEGLKSKKYYDGSLDDITTAEVLASSIMEANLDTHVIAEGGLITIEIDADNPWLEMGKVKLGDTVYVNSISARANIDGNYRVKKIHWYFNSNYGHKMIIEAGSKKNLFVESLMSKWKQLSD